MGVPEPVGRPCPRSRRGVRCVCVPRRPRVGGACAGLRRPGARRLLSRHPHGSFRGCELRPRPDRSARPRCVLARMEGTRGSGGARCRRRSPRRVRGGVVSRHRRGLRRPPGRLGARPLRVRGASRRRAAVDVRLARVRRSLARVVPLHRERSGGFAGGRLLRHSRATARGDARGVPRPRRLARRLPDRRPRCSRSRAARPAVPGRSDRVRGGHGCLPRAQLRLLLPVRRRLAGTAVPRSRRFRSSRSGSRPRSALGRGLRRCSPCSPSSRPWG